MLSDTSDSKWPVYRTAVGEDKGYTVMTGKYASIIQLPVNSGRFLNHRLFVDLVCMF